MIEFIMLLFGISGVIVLALVFILEDLNKLNKNHHMFSFLNLYATIALLSYSLYSSVWLFVWLNLMMLFVNLYGLYKVYKK